MYALCYLYSVNTDICKNGKWIIIKSKSLNWNFMHRKMSQNAPK